MQDLVRRLEPRQLLGQHLAVERRLHVHARTAEDLLQDAALEVDGEPLVQPEVAPGGVGHEIARPRVGELVRNQRDQTLVPGDDGRRREGQPRILHATERKAGRQHQQVVALPAIRPVEPLGGSHHRLGVVELRRGRLDHRRLGVHPRALPHRTEREIPDGERDQIRGDRLTHFELKLAIERRLGVVGGAHHRPQRGGRAHGRAVGDPHTGCVLQRDPAPRMNRLRLREHERVCLAGRLRRLEPLDAGGARARRVGDPHLRGGPREAHLERSAKNRVGRAKGKRRLQPVVAVVRQLDSGNRQVAGVESQPTGPLRHPLDVQRGGALERAPVEPHVPIELEVPDDHLVRVGE